MSVITVSHYLQVYQCGNVRMCWCFFFRRLKFLFFELHFRGYQVQVYAFCIFNDTFSDNLITVLNEFTPKVDTHLVDESRPSSTNTNWHKLSSTIISIKKQDTIVLWSCF